MKLSNLLLHGLGRTAILSLVLFLLLAQGASANLSVKQNGTITINSVFKYPVTIEAVCNAFLDSGVSQCQSSLSANNIPFKWDPHNEWYNSAYHSTYNISYENAGYGYSISATSLDDSYALSDKSTYLYGVRQYVVGTPDGMDDEPLCNNATVVQTVKNNYNNSKTDFPNTTVYMGNWRCFDEYINWTDVYTYDAYVTSENRLGVEWARGDMVYAHEAAFAYTTMISEGAFPTGRRWDNYLFSGKSIWQMIGGAGMAGDNAILNLSEIRALMFDTVATGAQGISIYGYHMYPTNPGDPTNSTYGLINNATQHNYFKSVANEIDSLSPILTLPHVSYSWEGWINDTYINISGNTNKSVCYNDCDGMFTKAARRFTYLLKQPNTSVSYLIAVNKDINASGEVQIKVGGMSGTQNVTFLGNATSGSGEATSNNVSQTITAVNGVFNDTFDGYAVHIYQISSAAAGESASMVWTTGIGGQFFQNKTIGSNRTCINQGDGSIGIGYVCDNFNDNNTVGWNETGNLNGTWTVHNGILNQSGAFASYQYWNVTSYENMSILSKFKEYGNLSSYVDASDLRGNLSRVNANPSWLNVQFSIGSPTQTRAHIYAYNGSDWLVVNNTATKTRYLNEWNYAAFFANGTYFRGYLSNVSHADALTTLLSSGTSSQWLNGTTIQFGGQPNSATTISWDEIRVVELDAQGNQYLQGNYSMNYTVPASQYAKNITVNGSYPAGTNYSLKYRQNGTGNYISVGGVKTADATIELPTPYYQSIDIMLEMNASTSDTLWIDTITVGVSDSNGTIFYIPELIFVSPTRPNGSPTGTKNFYIFNVSITNSSGNNLGFNWNGTNYTIKNDSLILGLNFNNASSMVDYSPISNAMTIGGNVTYNSSGKFHGAYDFNDSNSAEITTPKSGALLLNGSNQSFTMMFWVYPRQINEFQYVISSGGTSGTSTIGNAGYNYELRNTGAFRFMWYNYSATGGTVTQCITPSFGALALNTWQHTAVSFNGTTLRMFVNGSYISNYTCAAGSGIGMGTSATPIHIGRYFIDSGNYGLNGMVDELRIYNVSLYDDEIAKTYYSELDNHSATDYNIYVNVTGLSLDNDGSIFSYFGIDSIYVSEVRYLFDLAYNISWLPPTPEDGATISSGQSISLNSTINTYGTNITNINYSWDETTTNLFGSNLVLWYGLNNQTSLGESPTVAVDYSIYENNGTINSLTFNTSGKHNGAYDFDGTSGKNITRTSTTPLNLSGETQQATIMFWVYPRTIDSNYYSILSKGGSGTTGSGYSIIINNNNKWMYYLYNSTGFLKFPSGGFGSTISANQWYHVALSHNGTNVHTFVNGVYQSNQNIDGMLSDNTKKLYIGRYEALDQWYLNGSVDDVRIYNISLSDTDIQNIYDLNLVKHNNSYYSLTSAPIIPNIGATQYGINITDSDNNIFSSIQTINVLGSVNVTYNPPTLSNASNNDTGIVYINATVNSSDVIATLILNWNGTNYSVYNNNSVLWLNMDNNSVLGESNTSIIDVSKSPRIFTNYGTLPTISGRYNGGYSFDGTDYLLNSSSPIGTSPSTNITLSAWVKTAQNNFGWQTIMEISEGASGTSYLQLALNTEGRPLIASRSTSFGAESSVVAINHLWNNTWYYLTGTVNETGYMHLYVNGNEVGTSTLVSSLSNLDTLVIGSSINSGGTTSNPENNFTGVIDEVRSWNKSSSSDEIKMEYMLNTRKVSPTSWIVSGNISPVYSINELNTNVYQDNALLLPIGGGSGYPHIILNDSNVDYAVSDLSGLLSALSSATSGDIIYINDDARINFTSEVNISVPEGVTVASGRGNGSSLGAEIFTERKGYPAKGASIFYLNNNSRITGLRLNGTDFDIGSQPYIPNTTVGIHVNKTGEVDNNEISGFTQDAVDAYYDGYAHVHNNYIHHNRRIGNGYGVAIAFGNASALIEGNIFDDNRHSISGDGSPGTSYIARYNLIKENGTSHGFDMHGGVDRGDGTQIAGKRVDIYKNTFNPIVNNSVLQPAIRIRGLPIEGAFIHDNYFNYTIDDAIDQTNDYGNLTIYDNCYSTWCGTIEDGTYNYSLFATDEQGISNNTDNRFIYINTIPSAVTDTNSIIFGFSINNTWVHPVNWDMSYVYLLYSNGTWVANTSSQYLNLTYSPHYTQNISAQTVDTSGNMNSTKVWFNATIPNNAIVSLYNTGYQYVLVNDTLTNTQLNSIYSTTWIIGWNSTSQKWENYKSGWNIRASRIANKGDAVGIKVTTNKSISLIYNNTYNWTLVPGQNFIGLETTKTLSQINNSIGTCNADKIEYINLETQISYLFTCGQAGNASIIVNGGEGIFINSTNSLDVVRSW